MPGVHTNETPAIADLNVLKARIAAVTKNDAFQSDSSLRHLLELSLPSIPGYEKVLKIGRTRKNPIFLDIGCGFGNNVSQVVLDGYPENSVIATDTTSGLWDLGQELFPGYLETRRIPFVPGNPLDPTFLEAVYPFHSKPYDAPAPLHTISSLNALHGQVSVISACYIFNRFDEAGQLQLARAIAGLLSPEPGSMIIGVQCVRPETGRGGHTSGDGTHQKTGSYGPREWTELWDGRLFVKDTVRVDTHVMDGKNGELDELMGWTVVRV